MSSSVVFAITDSSIRRLLRGSQQMPAPQSASYHECQHSEQSNCCRGATRRHEGFMHATRGRHLSVATMTSVDLMTAVTALPFLSPMRSADSRVMTDTNST